MRRLVCAHSSERLEMSDNALKHGCTSEKLLLPDEDAAQYQVLLEGLMENYRPETLVHRTFVLDAARAIWILQRNNRRYDEIEQALFKEERDSTKWTAEQWKQLELRTRYRTTAERSCTRALKNLEHIRKSWAPEAKKPEVKTEVEKTEMKMPEARPTMLDQRIITTVTDGKTVMVAHPSNEELMAVVNKVEGIGGVIRLFEAAESYETWRVVKMSVEEWRQQAETEGEDYGSKENRA